MTPRQNIVYSEACDSSFAELMSEPNMAQEQDNYLDYVSLCFYTKALQDVLQGKREVSADCWGDESGFDSYGRQCKIVGGKLCETDSQLESNGIRFALRAHQCFPEECDNSADIDNVCYFCWLKLTRRWIRK